MALGTEPDVSAPRPASETWIASASLAFAAAILVPELSFPLARDQGVFACVAERMLHGALPYRDVWEIKPPPIYLVYTAILGAFGRSALAIHAADLITALLVSSLLYRLGRPS